MAHSAYLAGVPEMPGAAHGLAVIRHHKIMLTPSMGVDELPLGRVLDEVAHEGKRLQPTMPPI